MTRLAPSRLTLGLVLATSMLLTVVAVPSPTSAATQINIGMHVPREGDMRTAVAEAEEALGRSYDVVSVFKAFSDTYLVQPAPNGKPTEEEELLAAGHTLLVSWRATDPTNGDATRARRARSIAAGKQDHIIQEMADNLAQLEGRVLLRFQWEMDQPAPAVQHIGSPSEYIAAWRHMHAIVSATAPDVEFVWSPRANSFNKGIGQEYFPGKTYVDHIGGSAVPLAASGVEGAWRWPAEIYQGVHDFAVSKDRPMFLWVGVREKAYDPELDKSNRTWEDDPQWKATFMAKLGEVASGPWRDQLQTVVWYSTVSPLGYDFRYDTTARSRAAFQALVCEPVFVGSAQCRDEPVEGTVRDLPATVHFGRGVDVPFVGDWDGDGRDDLILRRKNRFLVDLDGDGGKDLDMPFGRRGEQALVVDLDRDGQLDPVVIRGEKWVADVGRDGAGGNVSIRFGTASTDRFVGDFDGDGWDDLISVSGRTWSVDTDIDGKAEHVFNFGSRGDQRLMANLTSTPGDEPVLARDTRWAVDGRHDGGSAEWVRRDLGGSGFAVAGDLDGDGDDDGGWYSDGTWSFKRTG